MPLVSAVVPTYNRWPQLSRTLDALSAQTVDRAEIEIIIVSDGSTDGTDDRLRDGLAAGTIDDNVTVLTQPNQGPAVARNTGVAAARGDLIVFIDDDVVPEPGCVAAHLRAHGEAEGPTVVIGPLLTPPDGDLQPWVAWEQRMLEKQYAAMANGDWEPTARQFYTGNASLTRSCFEASGGFDPSFLRGEDVELAYRLNDRGVRFRFDFDARAHHHAARSFESWLAIASAYGMNDAKLWRDKGQSWLLPAVRAEFTDRHPLVRFHIRLALRWPLIARVSAPAAALIARVTARAGPRRVGQAALSATYNLLYYRGLVDELGGPEAFTAIEGRYAAGALHEGQPTA